MAGFRESEIVLALPALFGEISGAGLVLLRENSQIAVSFGQSRHRVPSVPSSLRRFRKDLRGRCLVSDELRKCASFLSLSFFLFFFKKIFKKYFFK